MIAPCHFVIGSCFVGTGRGYIYLLYSRQERAVYVGQTNERSGVVGRLGGHVGPQGTLRVRLEERGVLLDEIADLAVYAHVLPSDRRFTGTDRAHREGVEHLVQKGLHRIRGELNPPLQVVSHVAYNPASHLAVVQRTALEVLDGFVASYR